MKPFKLLTTTEKVKIENIDEIVNIIKRLCLRDNLSPLFVVNRVFTCHFGHLLFKSTANPSDGLYHIRQSSGVNVGRLRISLQHLYVEVLVIPINGPNFYINFKKEYDNFDGSFVGDLFINTTIPPHVTTDTIGRFINTDYPNSIEYIEAR